MPELGRSPGERKGYPLQYSGLENSMNCVVHGVVNSCTRLGDYHILFISQTCEVLFCFDFQWTTFWDSPHPTLESLHVKGTFLILKPTVSDTCNAGDLGLTPGLGRFPGERKGYPLQYSCLENSMDGGAWWSAVHGVAKSWTRLSDFTFIHWRRKWQPTPVFLPGESQGRGILVGCRLWGCTELDTTEVT